MYESGGGGSGSSFSVMQNGNAVGVWSPRDATRDMVMRTKDEVKERSESDA